MSNEIIQDMQDKMEKTFSNCKDKLSGINVGRADPRILKVVTVEAYGGKSPLDTLASINVLDSRTIRIQVYDSSLVKSVEKAIANSSLGVNPNTSGNDVTITLPELSKERRENLVKLIADAVEEGKVAIRNLRRKFIDTFKKMQKDKEISEDDLKKLEKEVGQETDKFVGNLDKLFNSKKEEILSV